MGETHLETERLLLRSFHADLSDVDELHAIQSDPEHMRYYPHPFSRDETVAIASRVDFSLSELRYEYPYELVPENETPSSTEMMRPSISASGARGRKVAGYTYCSSSR